MTLPNEVGSEEGRKKLADNRRPSGAGDTPIETGHKNGVEDDVGHSPDGRNAHPHDGLSGNADKVAKDLTQPLK